MRINSLEYTTHEGIVRTVPIDTVRLIKPLTADDKAKAAAGLNEKGIEINPDRISARIEFADKSSRLAREGVDAFREQGVGLVNLGSDRYTPAVNITAAEAFTKEDAERLKGEDYTLKSTFRSKVETKAGTVLSSAHPKQVMDRRAKALGSATERPSSGTAPA